MSRSLFLFPEVPGSQSGYEIAVKADLNRISPADIDLCIFYSNRDLLLSNKRIQAIVLNRPGLKRRILNLASGRIPSTLAYRQLKYAVEDTKFTHVFCGDVILYEAVRKLFPNIKITIRFHNFFTKVLERKKQTKVKVGSTFYMQLLIMERLEQRILQDPNCEFIFITKEDERYAKDLYPTIESKVWNIQNIEPKEFSASLVNSKKLVWFGSLSNHKKYSLDFFIDQTYPQIRQVIPNCELHLYGKGTEKYRDATKHVFGKGFFKGDGVPMQNALYINPDMLGGGIKLKIGHLLEHQCAFISTQYGVEGYALPESKHIIIADLDRWPALIQEYFGATI